MSDAPSTEMALHAERIDFQSEINGRRYRLFVSVPSGPPPPAGHPTIYLVDGNLHFGIAVDTARIQSRWPDVRDPVVVGIGYPTASVSEALAVRTVDLTSPIAAEKLATGWIASMKAKASDFGGIDAYLRVLDEEVKPRVAASVALDPGDSVLMGHSLGGLTALHALFRRPRSFRQYVAVSPSIWWDDGAVLGHERGFAEQAARGEVDARLLLTVGALESTHRHVPGLPADEATMRAMAEGCRMVENTVELGARLAALDAPGLVVETVVHAGDDHNTVPPAGIARGVMFSMRRAPAASA